MRKKQYRGPVITQKELKSILDYNPRTGIFIWKKRTSNRVQIGDKAGAYSKPNPGFPNAYLQIMINGRNYTAHRLAWFYVHGRWPRHSIDHVNGDGEDNRLSNLREATQSQNGMNRLALNRNNSTGVRGVSITRNGTYKATIKHQWKVVFDKTYPTLALATRAISIARKKIFDPKFIPVILAATIIASAAFAEKPAVCLTHKQARDLWPRIHLWWYGPNHCWSNRRHGPPRNLRYDLIRENHAQSLPALSNDTPSAGKGDRAPTDASQPSRGTARPSNVVKIVRANEFNELDAQADVDTFFNAKPFPYQGYVLNLDRYSATFWHRQIWGLAKETK